MSAPSTISFSQGGRALFQPEEILELMEIEFERAQRYRYPVACIMASIDRLEQLHAFHGFEAKSEILHAIVDLLRTETREGDFLGCMVEGRILALFPHTNHVGAKAMVQRFLEASRGLQFAAGDRTVKVTLSVGLSHNAHPDAISFPTLVQVAEDGLKVADGAGGNRIAETELYQLYENQRRRAADARSRLSPEQAAPLPAEPDPLDGIADLLGLERRRGDRRGGRHRGEGRSTVFGFERAGRVDGPPAAMSLPTASVEAEAKAAAGSAPAPPTLTPEQEAAHRELAALVASGGSLENAIERMARQLVERAVSEVREEGQRSTSEKEDQYLQEIDILQRRIEKLARSLGTTEAALARIARTGRMDEGIASIFREVQGLDEEDPNHGLKAELMRDIFDANLAMRRLDSSRPRAASA